MRLREKLKNSQRDFQASDARTRFGSAPMPDQLLRMAIAGLGSQVLGFALSLEWFDHLEEWQSAAAVSREFDLHARRHRGNPR